MGLFQKKPLASSSASLYTLGMNQTILIVGLGNVGKKYVPTRHNVGFICLEAFAEAHQFDNWVEKKDLKSLLSSKVLGDTRVILCKPATMMNLSGEAVSAVSRFYRIPAENTLTVHDEIDIPFGQIRTRQGGGSAGHNGIKSLIQHIGDTFGRVRIGIQPDEPQKADTADFVLSPFSKSEQVHLPALKKETTSIITEYVYGKELVPETRTFIL